MHFPIKYEVLIEKKDIDFHNSQNCAFLKRCMQEGQGMILSLQGRIGGQLARESGKSFQNQEQKDSKLAKRNCYLKAVIPVK